MRQIVLDTETTGIGHEKGHRIIEIGCVELIDRRLTGQHFHAYLNPKRAVDEGAFKIHGISNEFLIDKPLFKEVVQEFLRFVDDSELIIHNAPFDIGFLNAELKYANWPKSMEDHCTVLDTLQLARAKHPGLRNNLDALCKRYEVDNSSRELHGALLDAEILALVYLAMTGGQGTLFTEESATHTMPIDSAPLESITSEYNTPLIRATPQELESHEAFLQFIVEKSGKDLWTMES